MKITDILLAGIVLAASARAFAVTVNTEPGGLAAAVGQSAAEVTELTVTGSVDAADLEFVSFSMPALRTLDLSGASVAAYSGDKLAINIYSSPANTIPQYVFTGSKITKFILPAGVTEIGDGAFAGSAVSDITLPAALVTIGSSAFADCASLTRVELPQSVTTIGKSAFARCPKLVYAGLRSNLTEIPDDAFSGCSVLETVLFPDGTARIGEEAFAGTALQTAALDKCTSLTEIGPWAFAGCASLTNVYLPAVQRSRSQFTVGEGAFFRNVALTSDVNTFAGRATEIPDYAFTDNAAMTVSGFDNSAVTSIGNYALRGNTTDTLTLPGTLEHIGTQAMADMTSLRRIDVRQLGENVPSLGDDVWKGVNQKSVNLEVTSANAPLYEDAPQWKEFNLVRIDPTAIDDIAADSRQGVTGSIEGDRMLLESEGADIIGYQLYDLQGRMIAVPQSMPAQSVTVPLHATDAAVLVVRVLLADNTTAVLKLAR